MCDAIYRKVPLSSKITVKSRKKQKKKNLVVTLGTTSCRPSSVIQLTRWAMRLIQQRQLVFFLLLISFCYNGGSATLNNRWSRRECSKKKRGGVRYFFFCSFSSRSILFFFYIPSISPAPFLLRGEAQLLLFSGLSIIVRQKRDTGALYTTKERKRFYFKKKKKIYISRPNKMASIVSRGGYTRWRKKKTFFFFEQKERNGSDPSVQRQL